MQVYNSIIRSNLAASGVLVEAILEAQQGGATIINTGGNQLQTLMPDVIAWHASRIVIEGGSNDLSPVTDFVAFQNDYLSKIESLILTNGVQYVVCDTIPRPSNGTLNANCTTMNNLISSFPALWNSLHPGYAGRVKVADVFTALGGFAAPAIYFVADGIHLSYEGSQIAFQTIATALRGTY